MKVPKSILWGTLFLTLVTSSFNIWPVKSFAINKIQIVDEKIDPIFLEGIREMKANGTIENASLIIWLSENQSIMDMPIEDLKIYATSLFTSNFNANVFYIGKALPVIMATVNASYVEYIASYEFVEHIGNGNEWIYPSLDVSKRAIRAENYIESLNGYTGNGLNIAIIDSGINNNHPDLDDLDDDPNTNDPKVTQQISFVDWDDDNIPDVGPMDNYGHGTHVAGIAAGTGESSGHRYVELRRVLGCGTIKFLRYYNGYGILFGKEWCQM